MSVPFIKSLQELVASGDYGDKKYPLQKIQVKIERSKGRYIFGPFCWKKILESDAPALLFTAACNTVAGVRGYPFLPEDPQHLLDDLSADNVFEAGRLQVEEARRAGRVSPPDQASVELPSYFSRLRFPQDEAYIWKSENWLQIGNRESPIHVDHGRVVSYIPPCAQHCFKIWVFYPKETTRATRFNYGNKEKSIERRIATAGSEVLVQRPGDVVCLNNLVFHAVLLVYRKNTKRENKSGGIFGDVIVRAEDRWESFRYATKVASGVKKGSREAWEPLLSAYSVMESGDYDPAKFQEAKDNFLANLVMPEKSEKARIGARAKQDKRRRKMEKMEAVRGAKKGRLDE
ncbi:hypothetical protein DVH05_005926 [Phytophthora capsici]|nr:hypothetical protein DVH05_005922 [Phytophthora capsici]KAG1686821.1 hypothetical protein DVH05_005926 [Phytophthora capsici]